MGRQWEEAAGSFEATNEEGRRRRIHIFKSMRDVTTHDSGGRTEALPGLMSLRTQDGNHVNRLDRGVYQVAVTGEVLRSDAPNAP